jgi:hypothetical protein
MTLYGQCIDVANSWRVCPCRDGLDNMAPAHLRRRLSAQPAMNDAESSERTRWRERETELRLTAVHHGLHVKNVPRGAVRCRDVRHRFVAYSSPEEASLPAQHHQLQSGPDCSHRTNGMNIRVSRM